ncbi:MAG: nucleotidyl transferase AbiEii/AbiGii toxin family protein, partial [Actinomycetota bacterium]
PRVQLRGAFEADGTPMRIKIEVNTHERSPALPHERVRHSIDTTWFARSADVLTFQTAELVATKPRALYQRNKGRDLFDLWLALTDLEVPPSDIIDCFEPYRPEGFTARRAIANLRAKLERNDFVTDLEPLVREWPPGYGVEAAAEMVIDQVLSEL